MDPSSYYSDEDDIDIHIRQRELSPRPVRYVQSRSRPHSYSYPQPSPNFLVQEQQAALLARPQSRTRPRDLFIAHPGTSQPATAAPVVINNNFTYGYSSEEESDDDRGLRRRRTPSSRYRSRSRSRPTYMTREEWEAECTRIDVNRLRESQVQRVDDCRLQIGYRNESELERTKRELDEVQRRMARAEDEKRIKKELEYKQLKEQQQEAEEQKRRDEVAVAAVEHYKKKEYERQLRQEEEKKDHENQYKRRLQEDLIKSGLDEKTVAAILKKEKVTESTVIPQQTGRPTYMRMSRKYLSIETLRTFQLDYDFDTVRTFLSMLT